MTDPITFTAIDGSTVTPRTRADLMQHPAFADLETDTEGNPCVWENVYTCECRPIKSTIWVSNWSCQCDEDCGLCGKSYAPSHSEWLPDCTAWTEDGSPTDEAYRLWERLPEKGDKEGEAVYCAMLTEHMQAFAKLEPLKIEGVDLNDMGTKAESLVATKMKPEKRYSVIITREITESCVIEVDAVNPRHAGNKALDWLQGCENPEWRVDEASADSEPYVRRVSEA